MSQPPKISICMPSFNSGQMLEEAIASVVFQRYPNLELIIHDGGSTDESIEILKRYDKHIAYWESVPDKGQSHATNKGFARATGDIIGVLNSDDMLLPGSLDYVAEVWGRHPDMRWMTGGCLLFGIPELYPTQEIIIPKTKEEWFYNWSISHPSTYVTREVIEQHGPYDESYRYCLDYEYWMRLAYGGEEIRAFQRPISAFRWHATSNSFRFQERFKAEGERVHETYFAKVPPEQKAAILEKIELRRISNKIYESVRLLKLGEYDRAVQNFEETVKENPKAKKTRAYYTTLVRLKLKKA